MTPTGAMLSPEAIVASSQILLILSFIILAGSVDAADNSLRLGGFELRQESGDYALFAPITKRAEIEAALPEDVEVAVSDWERSRGRLPIILAGASTTQAARIHERTGAFVSPRYQLAESGDTRPGAPVYLTPQLIVAFKSTAAASRDAGAHRAFPKLKNVVLVESNADDVSELAQLAEKFAARDDVRWVHPNFVRFLETRGLPDDPLLGAQWHLENDGRDDGMPGADINAADAWETSTGAGQIIAVIDNGSLHTHPDLAPNFILGYDPVLEEESATAGDPEEGATHGTATAGLAAARGDNGIGVAGVAHQAGFLPISLLSYSFVTDVGIANAFLWAVENDAGVISNSYGPRDGYWEVFAITPLLAETFSYVRDESRGGRGAVILFASGNGDEPVGLDGLSASAWSLPIGASTRNDRRAFYGDYGPPLGLLAPSSATLLVPPEITTTTSDEELYTDAFGATSAAAPQAAGVVALVRSVAPQLTALDVEALLRRSAAPIDSTVAGYDPNKFSWAYGAGRLDAARAVDLATNSEVNLPGAIDDLRIKTRGGKQVLEFTAPDSGNFPALRYDVRASTETLTEINWDAAVRLTNPPLPQTAGEIERIAFVPPFGEETRIAIRAYGNNGAPGILGNSVRVALQPKAPPARIAYYDFEEANEAIELRDGWARVNQIGNHNTFGITDSPVGNYPDETDRAVHFPTVNNEALYGLHLRFDERFFLETGTGAATGIPYDKGRIEVSFDDGANWQPTIEISNGMQDDWRARVIDLSGFDHIERIKVRFRLTSDVAIQMDGWYVDNVEFLAWQDLERDLLDVKDGLLGWESPKADMNGDGIADAGDLVGN